MRRMGLGMTQTGQTGLRKRVTPRVSDVADALWTDHYKDGQFACRLLLSLEHLGSSPVWPSIFRHAYQVHLVVCHETLVITG